MKRVCVCVCVEKAAKRKEEEEEIIVAFSLFIIGRRKRIEETREGVRVLWVHFLFELCKIENTWTENATVVAFSLPAFYFFDPILKCGAKREQGRILTHISFEFS